MVQHLTAKQMGGQNKAILQEHGESGIAQECRETGFQEMHEQVKQQKLNCTLS